jgi:hypothetical protein
MNSPKGRAVVERRQASASRRMCCRAHKARTVGYASVGVPLPFFSFVIF